MSAWRGGPRPGDVRERFLDKVEVGEDLRSCWNWVGYISVYGYGRMGFGKHYDPSRGEHNRPAHRVSWELFVGPIPDGLQLDHLCRNRRCVNPSHLEPVTCKENLRRGERAQQTHCLRGHPLFGENLYLDRKGFRSCLECRREARKRWRNKQVAA